MKDLYRNGSVQEHVFGFEDVSHPTAREVSDYPVSIGENSIFHADEGTSAQRLARAEVPGIGYLAFRQRQGATVVPPSCD